CRARRQLPPRSTGFAGRRCMDRERVDAALELVRQRRVDHAVSFEPGLSPERLRYNIEAEVRLAARAMSGMSLLRMGFVFAVHALGGEGRNELGRQEVLLSRGLLRSGPAGFGANKTLEVSLRRAVLPAVKSGPPPPQTRIIASCRPIRRCSIAFE